MADYALGLDYLTFALVAFSFFEILLLVKADQTARRAIESAERQTAISGSQADIQLKQQQLERMQFLATHRPRLKIRRVGNVRFSPTGMPVAATLIVANIGGTEAKIFEIGVDIYQRPKQRHFAVPIVTGNAEPAPRTPIEVAAGKQAIIEIGGTLPITITSPVKDFWRDFEVCALGVINYTDANDIIRSTGFFRIYRPEGGRFYPAPDDDPEADREWEN